MSTVLGERTLPEATRWLAWLAVLAGLALLYIPTYVHLAHGLWRDDAYAHGPIILAVFAGLVWRHRLALVDGPSRPAPVAGGLLLALGLALYVVGRSQGLALFEVASHLPVIAGILLAMRGWATLRAFAFPILFLAFLVPLPGFVLDWVTVPLKGFVSQVVEIVLRAMGYPIEREGVVLLVGDHQMLVADACSGLNSLYSLLAMGLLYLHLTGPSSRTRIVAMLAALVPIAVAANALRVLALVLVTYHLGEDAGQGAFHTVAGLAVFVVAFGLILLVDRAVTRAGRGSAWAMDSPALAPDRASQPTRFIGAMAIVLAMGVAAASASALKPLPLSGAALDLEAVVPQTFAGWRIDPDMAPVAPAPDVQANLDRIYTQVLSRTYVNDAGERMMLTVAHGGDQSDALKAHRQEACYKAQGFEIHDLRHGSLSAQGRTIPVTRMLAVRGERFEPVTYWFTMGDRVVLGRLERLEVQLASGLAGRIPDGMLVRVSSLSADAPRAFDAQQAFVGALVAALPPADVPRLVGNKGVRVVHSGSQIGQGGMNDSDPFIRSGA